MLEPKEIKKKASKIAYDYYRLLDAVTEILRSIPKHQKIVITDKSSGKQHIGAIKKIIAWKIEFTEDSTHNCYMFSVERLDFDDIYYLGEDKDVQISVKYFDEIKKQKERENNAKTKQ